MNEYDPNKTRDATEWLAIDEQLSLDLIVRYHQNCGDSEPEGGWDLHAAIHAVVENQIALEEECVPETMARLLRQGLARHEAIHAIGAVMGEDIFTMMKDSKEFDVKHYRRRLKKLTAKRWNKGQY